MTSSAEKTYHTCQTANGKCIDCGAPIPKRRWYCEACRRKRKNDAIKKAHAADKRKRTARPATISEINERARERGMSYGQYQAALRLETASCKR